MLDFIKKIGFWLAFWSFYVLAFVIGITVLLVLYMLVVPFALYEFLLHYINDRKIK